MPPKSKKEPIRDFYIYLISDATGTTLQGMARACLAQFDGIMPIERFWPMIRSEAQLDRAIEDLKENPGPVLYTIIDKKLRQKLERTCADLHVPSMPALDPIMRGLSAYTGLPTKGVPGLQHALDESYFKRIDAVDFALSFDDGQALEGIEEADVVLVGVSRTSKTPTCIYLARRGIKAGNIPLAPGIPFPDHIARLKKPLFVGLTEDPTRLVHLRRTRLQAGEDDKHLGDNAYLDLDKVEEETRVARKLFAKHKWPVIDVTRRSVEETAAEIFILLQKHLSRLKKEKESEIKV